MQDIVVLITGLSILPVSNASLTSQAVPTEPEPTLRSSAVKVVHSSVSETSTAPTVKLSPKNAVKYGPLPTNLACLLEQCSTMQT